MARQLEVLSMRDAEYFVMLAIVELDLAGSVNETMARRITAHCAARARKRGIQSTKSMRQAIVRMSRAGKLTLSPCFVEHPRSVTIEVVRTRLRAWVNARLLQGREVTARQIRDNFKCQHSAAGGQPEVLTAHINEVLLEAALQDRLQLPPTELSGHAVVLFSGWQSSAIPLVRAGYQSVINAEIIRERKVTRSGRVASVPRTTDLMQAPFGDQVVYACRNQRSSPKLVNLVLAFIPCKTFALAGAINGEFAYRCVHLHSL